MVVCNIFTPLKKETGNFLTFSQVTEDLTRVVGEQPAYQVRPSKFIALDVDYGQGQTNTSIPQIFQNKFENFVACVRKDISILPSDQDIYSFVKANFWNTVINDLEWFSASDTTPIKYMGDIVMTSANMVGDADSTSSTNIADGMRYSEIFCYIPNSATSQSFDVTTDVFSPITIDVTAANTPEGWPDGLPVGTVEYTAPIGNKYIMPAETYSISVNNTVSITTDPFKINTVIVLYDLYVYDGEDTTLISENIPMGVYFTGLISNGFMTNEVTKYVSNEDIFENGTSYGLRICSRFAVSPTQDSVQSLNIITDAESYITYASVMSAFAKSLKKLESLLNQETSNQLVLKEMLSLYRKNKVNVPYIKTVDSVDWWFVNGNKIIKVYDADSATYDGLRIQLEDLEGRIEAVEQGGPILDNSISTEKLMDYAVTEEKIADKFITNDVITNKYDIRGTVQELYIKKDCLYTPEDIDFVSLKSTSGDLYLWPLPKDSIGYGWTVRLSLTNIENDVVVPLVTTATGNISTVPRGTIVGYIVFKDIETFKESHYANRKPNNVIWQNAINLYNSPMINTYLQVQSVLQSLQNQP